MSNKKIFFILLLSLIITTMTACGGQISATSASPVGTGVINLSWDTPTSNTDGSPLTDLSGFKIYYGPSSNCYTHLIIIGGNASSYSLQNLLPGPYYVAITVYNSSGIESGFSNEVHLTISN